MKSADLAHQMHSKLSFRVQFQDQTSQRQSQGFSTQLESAVANGLDTSGLPVRVIRSSDTVREDVEPDFLIAGDVLEHNITLPETVESPAIVISRDDARSSKRRNGPSSILKLTQQSTNSTRRKLSYRRQGRTKRQHRERRITSKRRKTTSTLFGRNSAILRELKPPM